MPRFIALLIIAASVAACTTSPSPKKVASRTRKTHFTTPTTGSHISRSYTDDQPEPETNPGVINIGPNNMNQLGGARDKTGGTMGGG